MTAWPWHPEAARQFAADTELGLIPGPGAVRAVWEDAAAPDRDGDDPGDPGLGEVDARAHLAGPRASRQAVLIAPPSMMWSAPVVLAASGEAR
ncbi:hypothetical protein SAMN06265355_116138 [Actinomadura mexicana]|uniref:Uncharacterized protein n=1 Tax=Actinomadura mexicana TaxID=134959 RepID=A0A239E7T3_9ACTN|nr:hypothetical protein SAMN06265355_116138 [Actinomadura mexicana]